MSISSCRLRASAVLFALLTACTPPDRSDHPTGYTTLQLDREHAALAQEAGDVVEFFMYSCGHCHALDAPLQDWSRERPAIRFARIPLAFSARDVPLQRLYFAVQALPDPERLHRRVFDAIHRHKLKLDSEDAMAEFMVRQGVERARFLDAYRAPGMQRQLDRALALRHRYAIRAVPALVVADRFLTSPAMVQASAPAANVAPSREYATTQMVDALLAQARAAVPPADTMPRMPTPTTILP